MYDLVSLGEVMLRLSPPRHQRLRQATSLDVRVCGAQFNVAADFAQLGHMTAFLGGLPDSELGRLAHAACSGFGVDMSDVRFVPDRRMGSVFVEFGVEPRPTIHIYDRQGSAASTLCPRDYEWERVLKDAKLAHTDGIFLGLNENCQASALEFAKAAKKTGAKLCFDMNYREMIWSPREACEGYRRMLPMVDILVTNRSVSEMLFDSAGPGEDLVWRYRKEFGCRTVCLTSRHTDGSVRGGWKSMALHGDEILYGDYVQFEVVDRFGTGDAFFAGFLHGYLQGDVALALQFGSSLCALAHTVEGDVAQASAAEVLAFMKHGCDPRVKR